MNAFLWTSLVLYVLATMVHLYHLATGVPAEPVSPAVRAWSVVINMALAAWIAYILLGR